MKKLRIRFILAAMASMFAVLAAIVIGMNVFNYTDITRSADQEIDMILDNGGSFPTHNEDTAMAIPAPPNGSSENAPAPPISPAASEMDPSQKPEPPELSGSTRDFSAEAPYEIRYFTVFVTDGSITGTRMDNIAAVSEDEAKQYATELLADNTEKGFLNGQYRYRVTDTMIVFVDCAKRLDSFWSSLWTSVLVSVAALFVVLLLIVLTSKRIFKPVEISDRKQKQFLTDASHELKTPLAIIEANTEVMELENGESKWTESTRHQVQRLNGLIAQMIALTRLDETDYTGKPESISLSGIIQSEADSFRAPAEVANKDIALEIEDGIHIRANEQNIRQLIGILLDNAIKYATENTTIRVELTKKGKRASLQVSNQAEGLTVGDNNILFERFYRNDASRNSQTGGSGIGLSIAHTIVEKCDGRITAFSEDGKILTIAATFPRS